MKTIIKTAAKKSVKASGKKSVKAAGAVKRSAGAVMTPQELHKSMLAYGNKVTATKASALAFLKRIGAPV